MREHPWSRGVLGVSSARNIVVGAFDVLLVILALDALGLGYGGPGLLSALVGAGALASTMVTRFAVRRSRLRGPLITSIGIAATLAVLLGARTEASVAYVDLPLMGLGIASIDALSRTLLQRSSDPRNLGPLVAALGFVAGIGQVIGTGRGADRSGRRRPWKRARHDRRNPCRPGDRPARSSSSRRIPTTT